MFSPVLFRFSKLNSCLVLLFFLFCFHLLTCALSQRERGLCDDLYQCGNLTAGYPFWGVARPELCGHPSLVLHCHNGATSLIISGQMYRVFQIDYSSSTYTLRLARQDFLNETFCEATFTGTTLTPELFELLPDYKTLFVHYACDPLYHNPANFTCPNIGDASLHQDNNYQEHCGASFNITVPTSYDPEENTLDLDNLGSVLRKGFKVKLKINEGPCQECQSSGGICAYHVATPVCCKITNSSSEPKCTPMIPSGSSGPGPSKNENKKPSTKKKMGIGFAGGFLGAILLCGVLLWFFIRRRKKQATQYTSKGLSYSSNSMSNTPTSTTISGSNHSLVPSMSNLANGSVYFGVQVFSYEELEEATDNFSKELGDGGFGTVYYGTLKDGRAVAVKRLFERSLKRVEQFKNEIEILKSLKHPNLVILYGCTTRHSRELLLVYEYISNGTLAEHLHGNQAQSRPLCWTARLQIAIETASALSFLHTKGVIHRDVKTTNILLDNNCQVKVADFGLSRLFPMDQTHISIILIARLCKLGRIDDSLTVIGDMANGRLGLTPSTFHPILCALTRKNKIEEAWRVVESMRSKSVPMDVTSYNYFLTSHCYDGELESASEVMRKIEEDGISTDSRSYDALVLGACRAGKVEAAVAILRRMEDDGVTILYSTHAHVIAAIVKEGYYALGLEFVMAYAGKDLRLDAESFGYLAGKLVKRKRFEEAKIVLKEMVMRGLRMGDELRQFYEINVRNDDDDD